MARVPVKVVGIFARSTPARDTLSETRYLYDGSTRHDTMRYLPFGGTRDTGIAPGADHLFTGQVDDASVGLMWYASRAYDPHLGRFVSPDPLAPSPGDPQSLNRYSYPENVARGVGQAATAVPWCSVTV